METIQTSKLESMNIIKEYEDVKDYKYDDNGNIIDEKDIELDEIEILNENIQNIRNDLEKYHIEKLDRITELEFKYEKNMEILNNINTTNAYINKKMDTILNHHRAMRSEYTRRNIKYKLLEERFNKRMDTFKFMYDINEKLKYLDLIKKCKKFKAIFNI